MRSQGHGALGIGLNPATFSLEVPDQWDMTCDQLSRTEQSQEWLCYLDPSPSFSVSVAFKGVSHRISGLESAVAGDFANVAAKGLAALYCSTTLRSVGLVWKRY